MLSYMGYVGRVLLYMMYLSVAFNLHGVGWQLKDSALRDVGRARGAVTKTSRQASPGCRPARQGACVSGDGGHGRVQWRRCDSSGCWRILGSSEVFRNTALSSMVSKWLARLTTTASVCSGFCSVGQIAMVSVFAESHARDVAVGEIREGCILGV